VLSRERRSLDSLVDAPFTYPEVGATASVMPAGYHCVQRSEVIGRGAAFFAGASEALMSWEMHQRAGLHVTTSAARAEPDAVAVMRLGLGSLGFVVPCRVVYVVDEERRIGFAYGTLHGHPESGEEAFVVELLDDEQVRLHITAFSRPARWFTKLGGPVARRAQHVMTDRYVRALGQKRQP
jgi:uncharacterized protein (UPF0548 family)